MLCKCCATNIKQKRQPPFTRGWRFFKYSKRDLNPHSRNGQGILSPSCLPIPPFEHPYKKKKRAENETRTRDPNLGKVMLYQLSYFRIFSTGAKISSLLLTAKLFQRKVLSQPAKRINYLASKRFSASSIS